MIQVMAASGWTGTRGSPADGRGQWRRIAVLLESGRSGEVALMRAVALSREHQVKLAVVALAPQAKSPRCQGPPPQGFNDAVRDATAGELEAASRVIRRSGGAAFVTSLLVEGRDPPLERWVDDQGIDLVLLPARRPLLGHPRHPQARRLRGHAQVHVVVP
jgi:hypothetical protein